MICSKTVKFTWDRKLGGTAKIREVHRDLQGHPMKIPNWPEPAP